MLIRTVLTLLVLGVTGTSLASQAFLEFEGQYDPDISAMGGRVAFGGINEEGLILYLGSSMRFDKDYQVLGNPVTERDLVLELGAGLHFRPPTPILAVEPFGAVRSSVWFFDSGASRYINQWDLEYEYGIRLKFTPRNSLHPFARWSQKTGFFAGDSTSSWGLGIAFTYGKLEKYEELYQQMAEERAERRRLQGVEEEMVQTYVNKPVSGYFVVRTFDQYPGPLDLNPKLLNSRVKRWVRKNDSGTYQLFIGPFNNLTDANSQRMNLGFFRARESTIWEGKLLDLKEPGPMIPLSEWEARQIENEEAN